MATAGDIINRSLRLLGVLAQGTTTTGQESADALTALNAMLGEWSNERLMIYTETEDTHALVDGTASYTIGSGATINTTRPVEVISAFTRLSNIDTPVKIVGKQEYDLRSFKSGKGCPELLYYDGNYATGTIYLYPTPGTGYTLHLTSMKPFTAFAGVATTVTLPPGYEQALAHNLAVELAPEYGVAVSPVVAAKAEESKAALRRVNAPRMQLRVDPALQPGHGRGGFNITRGY